MHGDRARRTQQRTQNGVGEQRGFRNGAEGARQRAEQQHRIDEGVLVVRDDQQGPAARHVGEADDVDTPVEHAEEQTRRRREET